MKTILALALAAGLLCPALAQSKTNPPAWYVAHLQRGQALGSSPFSPNPTTPPMNRSTPKTAVALLAGAVLLGAGLWYTKAKPPRSTIILQAVSPSNPPPPWYQHHKNLQNRLNDIKTNNHQP